MFPEKLKVVLFTTTTKKKKKKAKIKIFPIKSLGMTKYIYIHIITFDELSKPSVSKYISIKTQRPINRYIR